MSKNYDYALALIENDVRNDCEYYVYSRLRDVVDGLENDNEVLTKLLRDALEKKYSKEDELQAENAKLREFAESYIAAVSVDCDLCPYCDPELCDTETDPMSDGCRLCREMRELGVEVD